MADMLAVIWDQLVTPLHNNAMASWEHVANTVLPMNEGVVALAALACVNTGMVVAANGDLSEDAVHKISALVFPDNKSSQELLTKSIYAGIAGAGALIATQIAVDLSANLMTATKATTTTTTTTTATTATTTTTATDTTTGATTGATTTATTPATTTATSAATGAPSASAATTTIAAAMATTTSTTAAAATTVA